MLKLRYIILTALVGVIGESMLGMSPSLILALPMTILVLTIFMLNLDKLLLFILNKVNK